jgi:uncharacterized membrane protein
MPDSNQAIAEMRTRVATLERVDTFSDGVFAIVITILVLDLRPPESADAQQLLTVWPRALGYAASYLFLAIVWINHHYLLRYVHGATPRLLWSNFAHLFTVSLVPFSTAWVAGTRLGATPVALYAGVFVLVNATYLLLCWEGIDKLHAMELSPRMRQMMRMRSFGTLGVFALAAVVALKFPLAGMLLVCACLVLYLRPEAPGSTPGSRLVTKGNI